MRIVVQGKNRDEEKTGLLISQTVNKASLANPKPETLCLQPEQRSEGRCRIPIFSF